MLNVNGEKMSKSLGNFTTLADVLDRYDPRAFRMLVLKTHYRRQMEVGAKELGDAQKDVESFDALLRRARARRTFPTSRRVDSPDFRAAMDDDFDTPAAVAVLQTLRRDANTALDEGRTDDAARAGRDRALARGALGLELADAAPEIDERRRRAGRATRRGPRRQGLRRAPTASATSCSARGIVLEDTPNGTVWRQG